MKPQLPLTAENKRKKIGLHISKLAFTVSFGWTLLSQFEAQIQQILSKNPEFYGNFGNPSNFEELYLRAQEIFFDGTGTIVKIYV